MTPWSELWQSFSLTLWTTGIALALAVPTACALAFACSFFNFRGKRALEAVIALPQALPPIALGFVLLEILSGLSLTFVLFSPLAVILVAFVISFPIVFFAAFDAFKAIPRATWDAGKALALSTPQMARCLALPLASRGITTGCIMAFSRSIGEFGATMIIAGYMPGRTNTLALSLYQSLMQGDVKVAKTYGLFCLGLAVLCQFATKKGNHL